MTTVADITRAGALLRAHTRAFQASIEKAAAELHKFVVAFMRPAQRRRHRVRCRRCSPYANPRPLTIDGHAYRRKTRSRRGRR